MALTPGTRLGHFEITALLGVGGMGEVYRATDTQLKRQVAIKVLPDAVANDADRLARFQREAEVLASLNHSNIAHIHGLQKSDGKTALVMELVEGPTLADMLASGSRLQTSGSPRDGVTGQEPKAQSPKPGGALPLDEALTIARQIADALDAAHAQGIVHRDLKPANVKVRPDGTVKVLDFGLAKAIDDGQAGRAGQASRADPNDVTNSPTITSPAMTHAGVILGTAAYMSPEQARGRPVDKRADVWAFGCVLYEMVTGRRPFEGEDITETIVAVMSKEPDWSSVPPRIRRLIQACLEKDPKKRLRDVADGWRLLDDAPVAAPGTAVAMPPRRRASIVPWAVAALLLVALAGLAWTHFQESPPVAKRVRFDIAPPEGATFASPAAVSPDGTGLVFTASTPAGGSRLYLRMLESGDTRALAGTEGNQSAPFWSPDSRFIAFVASAALKKIEVSSGAVQTICPIPSMGTFRGGAWDASGVILVGIAGSGLMRVPADGGTLTPVTKQSSGGAHTNPTFLSDHTHFLYTKFALTPGDRGIFLGALNVAPDQQQPTALLPSAAPGVLYVQDPDSASGYILHEGADRALMAQPFDPRALAARGEPIRIASDLTSGVGRPISASSNGVLVYRTGESNSLSSLLWFDRRGTQVGQLGSPDLYGLVTVSRDGHLVTLARNDASGTSRAIYVDVARNVFTRLIQGDGNEMPQAISPDGRIAFTGGRGRAANLYVKRAGGVEEAELLTASDTIKHPNDWSADGRYLIYDDHHPTQRQDLWVVPVAGDRKPIPFLVTPADETFAQFSPDGNWIAYSSDESGRRDVYVRGFDPDRRPAAAIGMWQISSNGGDKPRWSRDGKELFYLTADGKMMAVPVKTAPTFEPGIPVPLFDTRVTGFAPYDVSPDGRFLINTLPPDVARSSIAVVLNWLQGINK